MFRRQQFLALTGIRFIFRFGKSAARAAAWHTDDKFEATLPFVENDDRSRLGPFLPITNVPEAEAGANYFFGL